MKKNLIAVLLSIALTVGNAGALPVIAANTSAAQEAVEVNREDAADDEAGVKESDSMGESASGNDSKNQEELADESVSDVEERPSEEEKPAFDNEKTPNENTSESPSEEEDAEEEIEEDKSESDPEEETPEFDQSGGEASEVQDLQGDDKNESKSDEDAENEGLGDTEEPSDAVMEGEVEETLDENLAQEDGTKSALNGNVVASGICGENATWEITEDSEGMTLTVDGSGRMTDYSSIDAVPWTSYISSIKSLKIQGSITNVGSYIMQGGYKLENVSLGSDVAGVGESAFQNSNISEIILPNSITTISERAFSFCSNLSYVTFSKNLESIGKRAFYCSGIVDATFGDKHIEFGEGAFESCRSLETVTFSGEKNITFGDSTFSGCTNLQHIDITTYTTLLPEKCFYTCTSLKAIFIPLNTRIYKAFGKAGVEDVFFEGTRTQWGNRIEYAADDPLRSATIHYGSGGEEITSLAFTEPTIEVDEGSLTDISKNLEPWDAVKKGITYSSSDETIAKVDQTGTLLGKKGGTVTVTATINNTEIAASCKVVVKGKVTEIRFDKETINIAKGRKAVINAEVLPEEAYDKTLIWKSNNTGVATVDTKGNVSAVGIGNATITATDRYKNTSASCDVHVYTPIQSVTLDMNDTEMLVGDVITLKASVTPEEGTYDVLQWKSKNEAIATVDSNGNVTAVDGGTTSIICMAMDGTEEYAACNVTVKIPVERIDMTDEEITLQKNQTKKLSYTIIPQEANNKEVTWTSSDTSVATVDAAGIVTAINGGNTTITCTAKDGHGASANCRVKVVVPLNGIELKESSIQIQKGDQQKIGFTLSPEDTTEKEVTWMSTDSGVVTVDETGIINAVDGGIAKVRCAAKEKPDLYAECTVTVTIPVERIEIDENIVLVRGDKLKISAEVFPGNATNKDVSWTSSNTDIVTVDKNGNINAVGAGTATITCTASDGSDVSAVCKIDVCVPLKEIKLSEEVIDIYKGDVAIINAMLFPSDTTDNGLVWKSSNEKAASVDDVGKVTAVGKGTAIISCTSSSKPGITAECVVNVGIRVDSIALNRNTATIFCGSSIKLSADIWPEEATNQELNWKSSDESIASVDIYGKVVGKSAGTATITCRSKDGSNINASCKVTVLSSIENAIVTNLRSKDYTGKAITQNPFVMLDSGAGVVLLVNGVDYTVEYKDNIKAGTATLIIYGKGCYYGSVTKTFTIGKAANAVTASNFTRSYSAKAQAINLGAKATGGTLTYKSSNAKVKVTSAGKVKLPAKFTGIVKITITAGNNNYNTATTTISITVPTKTALSKVTSPSAGNMKVKWRKNTKATGYQIQYGRKSNFSGAKKASISKNTTASKIIKGLKGGKKYYVRIRSFKTVNGKKYYSAWSAKKEVKIK